MAGNGSNFKTFDEIFDLPRHKLNAALYWSPGTAKNQPLYSGFCSQNVSMKTTHPGHIVADHVIFSKF